MANETGAAPPPGPWTEVKEPISRSPWPPVALAVLLIVVFGYETLSGAAAACAAGRPDAWCVSLAFSPKDLADDRLWTLVSALFIHGNWPHVLFNSVFLAAFGAPVARIFGSGVKGAAAFFVFFLVCGVIGNLGYAAIHPGGEGGVIGASGGIAGLYGAASRLLNREGGVSPFRNATVIGMGAAWIVMNLLIAVFGLNLAFPGGGEAVAWEAHLAGYAAGLILIAPALRFVTGGRARA